MRWCFSLICLVPILAFAQAADCLSADKFEAGFERGLLYASRYQFDSALQQLDLIELQTSDAKALYLYVLAAQYPDSVLKQIHQLLNQPTPSPLLLLALAHAYITKGDYFEAANSLASLREDTTLLQLLPGHFSALQAYLFLKTGNAEPAYNAFSLSISANECNIPRLYMLRGFAAEAIGRHTEALADYELYLYHHYNDLLILEKAHKLAGKMKVFGKAQAYANLLVQLAPDNAEYRGHVATSLLLLSQAQEAKAHLDTAIEIDSNSARLYMLRATAHAHLNDKVALCADLKSAEALGSTEARTTREKICP